MIYEIKKQRADTTLNLIDDIKRVLAKSKEKLKKRQIYETLIKRSKIEIDSYKRFSRVFDAGVKDGLIDLCMVDNTKKRKELQDPFTKKEVIKLFDTIDDPETAMECLIGYYLALRINEAANLKWEELDMENLQGGIQHGKGRIDNQKVPFPRELANIIQLWREYCGGKRFFFPSRINGRDKKEYKSIHRDFRKALAQAGLDIKKKTCFDKNGRKCVKSKFVFHTLRRTRAVFLHRYEGWSLRQLQVFLRHKDIQTTQEYVNVDDKELRNLLDNQPYRFNRPIQQVTEQEPTPQFKLELLKEMNKKQELELMKLKEMKELKELEVNLTK